MNVTLPNGVVVEDVPDGASKDEIMRKSIAGGYATAEDFPQVAEVDAEQPAERTFADKAKRVLGRAGRMTADGIAAFPLTAMDAGVGLRNLYSEISNLNREPLSSEPLKETYPSYSQLYKEAMDKSALPPAEGLGEKLVDVAGTALVGSKTIPNMSIKNPAPAVTKLLTPAEKAINAGVKHDVPVFYDDVAGNASKKISTMAERIPIVGTGGGRAAQQQAVNQAAGKLTGKYYQGDNIPDLVQKGLQSKLNGFRKAATKLYDDVGALVTGRGQVKTDTFDDALLKEMSRQEGLGTAANPEVVKVLEKYSGAPRGDFAFIRELRSQLGDDISGFYKPGSAVGDKGAGAMEIIKKALEKDMGKFADDASPAARAAWKRANAFYAQNVIPFKQAGLRQLVKTDEPAKAWRYLVQESAGVARAEKMFRSLDSSGRNAVRAGLLDDATQHATTPKGDISPAKFAQYMEKHSNAIKTFFKGDQYKEIEGFRNLMRHVERAGQYAENPPTGARLIEPLMLVGATASWFSPAALTGMLSIGGVTGGTSALLQSTAGRNILISMSKVKPGTQAFDTMAKGLAATVATQSKNRREAEPLSTSQ
jgi:hypothetical protein